MIVSTPHGMNMFYKLWVDAEEGRNTYIPIEVHWSEVPGRDENGKKKLLRTQVNNNLTQNLSVSFLVLLIHLYHHQS